MPKRKKPARIHVRLDGVVQALRGAYQAVRGEAFQFGRSADYCDGAGDAVGEFLARCRILFGAEFVERWEESRPAPGATESTHAPA